MLPSYWNKSITVLRAPKVAGRGSDFSYDWENATEHVARRCFFATVQTGEDNDFREAISLNYVLRGPANLDLEDGDRVRLYVGAYRPDEPEYQIIGAIRDVPSASGRMDHRRAELQVWEY